MPSHGDVVALAGIIAGAIGFALLSVVVIAWLIMHDRRRTEAFMVAMQDRMLVRNYNELAAGQAVARGAIPSVGWAEPPETALDRKALEDVRKAREAALRDADQVTEELQTA